MEAFSFCRVAALPNGEKAAVKETSRLYGAEQVRKILGDGSYGGAYQIDDAAMQRIFDVCVAEIVEKLRFA
jgi:hypothetical protein